jgi:hypothetical protein
MILQIYEAGVLESFDDLLGNGLLLFVCSIEESAKVDELFSLSISRNWRMRGKLVS